MNFCCYSSFCCNTILEALPDTVVLYLFLILIIVCMMMADYCCSKVVRVVLRTLQQLYAMYCLNLVAQAQQEYLELLSHL